MPLCRFCSAPLQRAVVDLGLSPLSNALLSAAQLGVKEQLFPLRPLVCETCWLMQLPELAAPAEIFSDYVYVSSYSDEWLRHVEQYAKAVTERLHLSTDSLVVEVGSNDGHLLRCFSGNGIRVLGVEPAANVAAEAIRNGIPTEVTFFGETSALKLRAQCGQADLIAGNNVLAHVPKLNDFVAGLRALLKPGGTITLEFPHLLRLIERIEFDTIYHEHFSYFSLAVAQRVFARHGLTIYDVDELSTHGGSLRIYAAHTHAAAPSPQRAAESPYVRESPHLREVLTAERAAGLETLPAYERFASGVAETKTALLAFLSQARAQHKDVAGYGAPAKATTLLNYCGIKQSLLPYTVDRSPLKQGKYIPGVRIPIESPARIFERKPAYVLILPWNWAREIEEQMSAIREWGGRFVLPIPALSLSA